MLERQGSNAGGILKRRESLLNSRTGTMEHPGRLGSGNFWANSAGYFRDRQNGGSFRNNSMENNSHGHAHRHHHHHHQQIDPQDTISAIPRPMFMQNTLHSRRSSGRDQRRSRFGGDRQMGLDSSSESSRRQLIESTPSLSSPEQMSEASSLPQSITENPLYSASRTGLSSSWPNFGNFRDDPDFDIAAARSDQSFPPPPPEIVRRPSKIQRKPSKKSAGNVDQESNRWSFLPKKYSPSVQLLRRVNERAKKTESLLLQLKIMAIIHLMAGLVMLALDWAQILLLWEHTKGVQLKIFYLLRSLYPAYITGLGCATVGAAMNRRSATKLLLVTTTILLSSFCLAPSNTPLIHSIVESVQFSRAKSQAVSETIQQTFLEGAFQDAIISGLQDFTNQNPPPPRPPPPAPPHPSPLVNATSEAQTGGSDPIFVQYDDLVRKPPVVPHGGRRGPPRVLSDHSEATSLLLREIFGNANLYKSMIENYFTHYTQRLELMNTVDHLRIAYCIGGSFQIVVSVMTMVTASRLVNVQ